MVMRNIFQNRLLTVTLVFFIITSFCSAKSHIIKDMQHFIIKSHKKSTLEIHRKIWVDDEKGKALGKVLISNNEYCKVKNIKGKILDKNGRTIQKLKKKDIRKFKGSFAHGLYADICHVAFQLSHTTFPYIIEYSYKLEINSLFFWKSWLPQSNFRVIKSIYKLTAPEDILYKTFINKRVEVIEKELPPCLFTAYSGYKSLFKIIPSDYSEVFAYVDEKNLKIVEERFPKKMGKANLIILKMDEHLKKFDKITLAQLFVDLWNINTWYAKEFLNKLEVKINGILERPSY